MASEVEWDPLLTLGWEQGQDLPLVMDEAISTLDYADPWDSAVGPFQDVVVSFPSSLLDHNVFLHSVPCHA